MTREKPIGVAFDLGALQSILCSVSYVIAVELMPVIPFLGWFGFSIVGSLTVGLDFLLRQFSFVWLYLVGTFTFGCVFSEAKEDRGTSRTAAAPPGIRLQEPRWFRDVRTAYRHHDVAEIVPRRYLVKGELQHGGRPVEVIGRLGDYPLDHPTCDPSSYPWTKM